MVSIESILEAMRENPGGVRFKELATVCDEYFGWQEAAIASIACPGRATHV